MNLIYPRGAGGSAGKLVAVDAKKRSGDTIRSRQQASKATTFEAFDLDKLRDLVGGATGRPYDRRWGTRITGADPLTFAADTDFAGLGKLCRELTEAHDRDDYRDSFGWLDAIRPITDPALMAAIQDHLVQRLKVGDIADLDIAPPEIIDWARVDGFKYHFDQRGVRRPDIRLSLYIAGLLHSESDPDVIDLTYLQRKSIQAIDSDNHEAYRWSVWRCLCGEFEFQNKTYVVDEGEIFEVSTDYLQELNEAMARIPNREDLAWPSASPTLDEDDFNDAAANALAPSVLMDKQLVKGRMQTTTVEVCDVLTAGKRLIHVKRHLGSRDLSHLFSQGFVSANLLQSDAAFRRETHKKVKTLSTDDAFNFFDVDNLNASDFEVIFVIVAAWCGRSIIDAMPFFSKVNLKRTVEDLINRGFKVGIARVDTGPEPSKPKKKKKP